MKVICNKASECKRICDDGHNHPHEEKCSCKLECSEHVNVYCVPIDESEEWRELDATKPHTFPEDLIVDGNFNNDKYEYEFSNLGTEWVKNKLQNISIYNGGYTFVSLAVSSEYYQYYKKCNYRVRKQEQSLESEKEFRRALSARPILTHEQVFDKWFKSTKYVNYFRKVDYYNADEKIYSIDNVEYSLEQLNAKEWFDVPPQGSDNE